MMAPFILTVLFVIATCIESTAYAVYEIKINKNKPGGIVIILLSLIGLVFPIMLYIKF